MRLFKRKKKKRVEETIFINDWSSGGLTWSAGKKPKDKRAEINPIQIVKELEDKRGPIKMSGIDDKIKTLQKRKDFIEEYLDNTSTKDEDKAIEMLKAIKRSRGCKNLNAKIRWKTTTQTKIDSMIKKYKLSFGKLRQFIRKLPKEAIDEMIYFTKVLEQLNKKLDPEFYIIAPTGDFDKVNDPILLAKSPIDKCYYILGAWDEEVEILDELL